MWRKWIKYKGIQWVADKLGLHYETVRAWANDGTVPVDKHKLQIIKLAKGDVKITDFYK